MKTDIAANGCRYDVQSILRYTIVMVLSKYKLQPLTAYRLTDLIVTYSYNLSQSHVVLVVTVRVFSSHASVAM